MAEIIDRWQAQGCVAFPCEEDATGSTLVERTFRQLGYKDTLSAMMNQRRFPEIGLCTVDWVRPIDGSQDRYPRFHLEISKAVVSQYTNRAVVEAEVRVHIDERPHVTAKTELAGQNCLREVERLEKDCPKPAG
ncbi:MAG TPA: hypothetical protein VF303_00410 [Candidatus Nanoarchaeia archaeon]